MKPGLALLVALTAAAAPGVLIAQTAVCRDSDRLDQCATRMSELITRTGGEDSVQAERAVHAHEAELARKPTGVEAVGRGLGSAIGDFLPALAGALGFTPTTTAEGAAAFESNLRLPVGAGVQKVRLQLVLRDAAIYEPLRQRLPEPTREERTAALERELRDFDDVRVSAAWNLEGRSFGRSFQSYRALTADLYRLELKTFHATPGITEEKQRLDREAARAWQVYTAKIVRGDLRADQRCEFDSLNIGRLELRCLNDRARDDLMEIAGRMVRASEAVERELDDQLERTGFYDLPDLINNQPQLSAQLNVDLRRDLAGPNEVSGSIRYEAGFTNMNGLRRACQSSATTPITLECLRQYARAPARMASLRRGDRFFVTASYARRQDYAVALDDDGVSLTMEGTWDLTGELGYGRYVAFNQAGEQIGRIDLTAQYVHHEDDPERQSRFVGSATYTQRVSAALSLAAGFSYASKPEFLGDVDRKVSANFGLRYKLLSE